MFKLRHVRHDEFSEVRRSKHFLKWLASASSRLQITTASVFAMLRGSSTIKIDSSAPIPHLSTLQSPPVISGIVHSANTITCSQGKWLGYPLPSFTYQWYKAAVAIAGQTAATYLIAVGDVGSALACTVTATNTSGSASATSASVTPAA